MRHPAQQRLLVFMALQRAVAPRRLSVSLLLLAVMVLLPLSAATGQTSEEARLDEAEAQLAAVRAEMERTEEERDVGAAALAVAQRRLAEVQAAVDAAEQAVQRQQRAVADAGAMLEGLEGEELEHRAFLVSRVVEEYKRPPSSLESALAPGSVDEFLRRTRYLDAMARADQTQLERARLGQTRVAAQREQLKFEQQVLDRVVSRKRALLAGAEELREDRALRVAAADDKLDALAERERLLEADSQQLATTIERSSRTASVSRSSGATAPARPATGGSWVWPTGGPVTSEFGPRWGRMHEGIDIGAPTGAPIYAAANGVVTFAGTMGGYGQLTLIDHGSGIVSASAHQSRIGVAVGQHVAAGQVIGTVGATGNVTGPHLHFETRVNGSPQNPRNYLP